MSKDRKKNVREVLESVDDFHAFLVLVIPALKEWIKAHSANGVREAARELHEKLGVKFDDARSRIEEKHSEDLPIASEEPPA